MNYVLPPFHEAFTEGVLFPTVLAEFLTTAPFRKSQVNFSFHLHIKTIHWELKKQCSKEPLKLKRDTNRNFNVFCTVVF